MQGTRSLRAGLIWAALAAAVGVPIALAATSDFLAYRGLIYIVAGFAGIVGLALLLIQPLLAGGYLPGLEAYRGRRVHRWVGGVLVAAVIIHVAGLWYASPPDMIDALLFRSPTPFSPFGVVAMWAIFATALLAAFRRRLTLKGWRMAHLSLAAIIILGTVTHGLLIEGTMETMSKAAVCVLVVLAAAKVMTDVLANPRRKVSSRAETGGGS